MIYLTPADLVFQASPLTFDPSVVEIFTTFYAVATLSMLSDSVKRRPRDLVSCLTLRNPVTVIQATPTLIASFGARQLQSTLLSAASPLRILAFGGEPCPSGGTLQL